MKYDLENMTIAEIMQSKADIIKQKKQMIKHSDTLMATPMFVSKGGTKTKSETSDSDMITVKVIANMANWMDSQSDVLSSGSWVKSISDKGINFPFLNSHIHTLDAIIGDTKSVYSEQIKLDNIGVKSDIKTSTGLIFEADILKAYNEKIFNLYKSGKVNQHSIGLQYVSIDMAVNDSEYKTEYELWNEKIDTVINKEAAESQGYFFYVSEIKLLENSAVLWGANSLTPTLEIKEPLDNQHSNKAATDNGTLADFVEALKNEL